MDITEFSPEILENIFKYCNYKDLNSLNLVNKYFSNIINEFLPHQKCLESNPNSKSLEGSWKKRWEVISSYSVNHCQKYSIDLDPFFEKGLGLLHDSISFFQNEVILFKPETSLLYRCNLLNYEMKELNCKVKYVHQVYYSSCQLAIASKNKVTVYDLKKDHVIRYSTFLNPGIIKFFDGIRLVYFSREINYLVENLDENPIQVSDRLKKIIKLEEMEGKLHEYSEIYFNERERSFFKKDNYIYNASQNNVVNYQFFTREINLNLGVNNILNIHSGFKKINCFKLDENYQSTAFCAKKEHLIIGLANEINKKYALAIWNYHKDETVFFECAHRIQHLIVNEGMILISELLGKRTLLDFTGQEIDFQPIEIKHQNIKPENSFIRKMKNYYNHFFAFDVYLYHGVLRTSPGIIVTIANLAFVLLACYAVKLSCCKIVNLFRK